MSPEAFVELLARELRVAGVVVGANYRFGYRAAGTAQLLQQLAPQHGLRVRVLGLVGGEGAGGERAVSSSHVRTCLAGGELADVAAALGRPYRLVVRPGAGASASSSSSSGSSSGGSSRSSSTLWLPAAALENQPPGPGAYEVTVSLMGSSEAAAGGGAEAAPPCRARLVVDGDALTLEAAGPAAWEPGLLGCPSLALDFC